MSLKGFQKAAIRVRIWELGKKQGSKADICARWIGSPNPEAKVQYCMCICFNSKVDCRAGSILYSGLQGEHTKDAVYIDSERRFQELEKVYKSAVSLQDAFVDRFMGA